MGKASITIAVSSVFNGNGFDKAIDGASRLGNKLSRMERLTAQNANSMTSSIATVGAKWESMGDQVAKVGDRLTKSLTLPMAAGGAYAGKMAIEFDTALANVRKTSDLTESQLEELAKSALELSKTQPVNAQTILNIEALGAQLGISNGKLEAFAKTVSGLDIATNMNAETAATEMARFANIVGMAEDEFSNYGSTLVAIGNNMATTESEVSQMAQRFASAGAQAGLSEAQILGMSAAMSSLGIRAEMGGSALSQIFVTIGKAVSQGGAELDAFAKRSGMSASEFRKAWGKDAAGAFNALIEGIGGATAAGEDMNVIMSELGFTQIRQSDVMRRLAGSTEAVTQKQSVLSSALELSTSAWEQNTALQKEVDQRNESMASRIEVLKNKLNAIAITIGRPLVDAVIDAVEALDPMIQGVADAAQAFADMDEGGQRAVIAMAGLAAGAGPVMSVTGRLMKGFGSATSKLAVFTDAMNNLDGANLRTYGSAKSFASALGLSKNAAVKAAGGVDKYVEAWDKMHVAAGAVKKVQKELDSVMDGTCTKTFKSEEAAKRYVKSLVGQRDEAERVFVSQGKIVSAFGNSTKEAEKAANGIKALEPALEKVRAGASDSAKVLDSYSAKMTESTVEAKSAAKSADGLGLAMKSVAMQMPGIMLAGTVAVSVGLLAAAFAKCEEKARDAAKRQEELAKASQTFSDVAGGVTASAEGISMSYESVAKGAREAVNGVAEMNAKAQDTLTQFAVSRESLDQYVATIEQLGNKGNLTALEQGKLSLAVEGYNKITGDSVAITDAARGSLSKSTEKILENARAWEENARKQALQAVAQGYIEEQVKAEIKLKSTTDAYNRALADKARAEQIAATAALEHRNLTAEEIEFIDKAHQSVEEMSSALEESKTAYDSAAKSSAEATSAMALDSSNLAQSVKSDIASQKSYFQDFALAVATHLQNSGQSVGTFQENLAAMGADTEKMSKMGAYSFDQLWRSCNGDVGLMIQKINDYNGVELLDKRARLEANGNVASGHAKQITEETKRRIDELRDKGIFVDVNGNYSWAKEQIWGLGSAIGSLPKHTVSIVDQIINRKTNNASGGIAFHARGGIATRATDITRHIAGEAGAEAIVPLTNRHYVTPFAQVVAQETVAAMRGDGAVRQAGGNTYVLNINGTQIQSSSRRVMEAVETIFNEMDLMNMMGVR